MVGKQAPRFLVRVFAGITLASAVSAADRDGHRIAFVTSVSGSANLSSWPEADRDTTGLLAADSICRNLAETAGLDNFANFMAFLSDSNDDAYCRINELSGKRDDNCGQPTLPASAGPWVRTDGVPFGASIDRLLASAYEVYFPLDRDESANPVSAESAFAWTGTSGSGKLIGTTCADWTDENSETARIGVFDLTSEGWQFFGSRSCSQTAEDSHLICMETGVGTPLDLPAPDGRLAFITSVRGNAIFESWPDADDETSGLAAADSICNNRADVGTLPNPGTYRAWLSTSEVNARDRFVFDGAWYRPDGFLIANDLDDLTDGQLQAAMNESETGNYIGVDSVWTGTDVDGTAVDTNCDDWQVTEGSGWVGRANTATSDWGSRSGLSCSASFGHLYCLSDARPETFFDDGFESTTQ